MPVNRVGMIPKAGSQVTDRTTAIPFTTIYTVDSADNFYGVLTAVVGKIAATGTATAQIRYTDSGGTVQTVTLGSVNTAVLGSASVLSSVLAIKAKLGTDIQAAVTITGSPTFDAGILVLQVSDNA